MTFTGAFWFMMGAFWGLVNLYFIKQLLYGFLIQRPWLPLKMALLVLIKFPVLYGVGFGFLYYQEDIPWALLAGFSISLVLGALKAFQPRNNVVG